LAREFYESFLPPDHWQECEAIATIIDIDSDDLAAVNLYYDLVKLVIGCTAFAVDTDAGPLHARNLDWWTERGLLSAATLIVEMVGAPAGPFYLVTWPGFIGALSGIAPGRFAITLNAALSDDPPLLTAPVSVLIRQVFEHARSYDGALDHLSQSTIASDCLLLISGTKPREMAVIERTPERSAVRGAEHGYVAVTNDYLLLPLHTRSVPAEQPLQATSCSRFNRAVAMLKEHRPRTVAECVTVLTDPDIEMNITVQQMVMSAATGLIDVRLPGDTTPL
jgi:acid ceramidase